MFDLLAVGLIASQFFSKQFPQVFPQALDIKDPMQLMYLLRSSPEKSLELYKHMLALEQEIQKLILEDRLNARQIHQQKQWSRWIFLFVAIIGLISCFVTMNRLYISKELLAVVSALAGILGVCLRDIYACEFGSAHIPSKRMKNPFM